MTSSTILFVCQESPDESVITSFVVTVYEEEITPPDYCSKDFR